MAICLDPPRDPDHEVPSERVLVRRLRILDRQGTANQYLEFARRIVTVVRLDGLTIEGDNGVKANAAQIMAWWCAEDAPELATACVASPQAHAVLRPGRDGHIYRTNDQQREEPNG